MVTPRAATRRSTTTDDRSNIHNVTIRSYHRERRLRRHLCLPDPATRDVEGEDGLATIDPGADPVYDCEGRSPTPTNGSSRRSTTTARRGSSRPPRPVRRTRSSSRRWANERRGIRDRNRGPGRTSRGSRRESLPHVAGSGDISDDSIEVVTNDEASAEVLAAIAGGDLEHETTTRDYAHDTSITRTETSTRSRSAVRGRGGRHQRLRPARAQRRSSLRWPWELPLRRVLELRSGTASGLLEGCGTICFKSSSGTVGISFVHDDEELLEFARELIASAPSMLRWATSRNILGGYWFGVDDDAARLRHVALRELRGNWPVCTESPPQTRRARAGVGVRRRRNVGHHNR